MATEVKLLQMEKPDVDTMVYGIDTQTVDKLKKQLKDGLFVHVATLTVNNFVHLYEVGNFMTDDHEKRIEHVQGKLTMRSISVGDIVKFTGKDGKEKTYACADIGWKAL